MLTDDYTLAILPLARLLDENGEIGQCCTAAGRRGAAYRGVLESGVLGYRLYTYHGLVRERFGREVEQKVRERHIGMLAHVEELDTLLAVIEAAVGIGTVTTPTPQGDIATPVELNVALALMLGMPRSPHYVSDPRQRAGQLSRIAPEIDWCFADCLERARREMTGNFDALTALLSPSDSGNRTAGGQVLSAGNDAAVTQRGE